MANYVIARANMLVFAVLVAILIVVGGATWDSLNEARHARVWSQHSDEVLFTIKDLDLGVHDAETGQRGFLLTGSEAYLAPYETALSRFPFLSGELQRLTADNPLEQQRLRSLAPLLQRKLEELAQ